MLTAFRKLLKALVTRADLGKRVTPKMFRHTYSAARLQTLDGGVLVSLSTVGKELGHGGDGMVKACMGTWVTCGSGAG
jgi:integrase